MLYVFKIVIATPLFAFSLFSAAQKQIVISDSFAYGSNKFEVKGRSKLFTYGTKFQFGDFTVISPKQTSFITRQSQKIDSLFNRLPKTFTEFVTPKKFSFKLGSKTKDTAIVTATSSYLTNELIRKSQVSSTSSLTISEVLKGYYHLLAFIKTNRDSTSTWALAIEITDQKYMVDSIRRPIFTYILNLGKGLKLKKNTGVQNPEDEVNYLGLESYDGFLTNGERSILIRPVTSGREKKGLLPALGYEFIENSEILCTVQYNGGGILGVINRNAVWLNKNLDAEMKIVLAATAGTVLFENEMLSKLVVEP